jgi:hypothetical protein
MSSDHEAEIRASVAAHQDLGPRYDDAVAEGLVERIGTEIDKRIDARLGSQVPGDYQGRPAPGGYQGYLGPVLPPGYQVGPPPARPGQAPGGQRSVATTITALGSMALGVGATAIVSHAAGSGAAQAVMVLLIWAAITIINVAYARHR